MENIKTKKVVLVHGEGFGAWCWYKNIALLEESGLVPVAVDLTGSGIDLTDINNVATLTEYSKPLIDFLEKLAEDEKVEIVENHIAIIVSSCVICLPEQVVSVCLQVILVGHSSGGACISYALEHFAEKISKAVYVCATMISDGQRAFDVFAEEVVMK